MIKLNEHHIAALMALDKAGQPVEKHYEEALHQLVEVVGGLTPYELEVVIGPNWASHHVVMDLFGERLIGYKVQIFGDFGKYFITDAGKQLLVKLTKKA